MIGFNKIEFFDHTGSPELAAGSIFVVGLLSEVSQFYWPKGIFRGTFDPFDIAAYGVSLLVCYVAERREPRCSAEVLPPQHQVERVPKLIVGQTPSTSDQECLLWMPRLTHNPELDCATSS